MCIDRCGAQGSHLKKIIHKESMPWTTYIVINIFFEENSHQHSYSKTKENRKEEKLIAAFSID